MTRVAPDGLSEPGVTLWDSVCADFALSEHEAAQLEEACRIRDTISQLRAQLADDGLMIPSSQGMRLHPVIAEIRQQQLALARLLFSLRVPPLEEDDLPPAGAVRGTYSTRPRGAKQ